MRSFLTKYKSHILYTVILVCLVFTSYWHSMFFPFVHDDFAFAEKFEFGSPRDIIIDLIDPRGKLFYRPLSYIYMFVVYKLFGLSSLAAHGFSLGLHVINSFLVGLIAIEMLRVKSFGYAVGIIYAVGMPIHVDVLSWSLAGIQDLGGQLGFLLCLFFFLKERYYLSLLFFIVALLFKESTVVILPILYIYSFVFVRNFLNEHSMKKLLLFLVPTFLYGTVKLFGASVFSLPPTHPYHVDFIGVHILKNLLSYLGWIAQVVIPYRGSIHETTYILPVIILFFIPLLVAILHKTEYKETTFFLYIWVILPLFPVVFLPNHTYRYYATYSLPPMLMLFGLSLKLLIGENRFITRVIGLLVIFLIVNSAFVSHNLFRKGRDQKSYLDGTNLLIPRAAMVEVIYRDLQKYLPYPPDNSMIILKGADLGSINWASGIKLLYKRIDIMVFSTNPLEKDQDGYYIQVGSKKDYVDTNRVFFFRLRRNKLQPLNILKY